MRRFPARISARVPALVLAAALAAPIAPAAQEWSPPGAETETGPESGAESGGDIFERGLESFMQNMLKEAEPHLDRLGRDLGETVNSLRPILGDIGTLMDDVKNYQAPERLENGDILIRRKTPEELEQEKQEAPQVAPPPEIVL